MEDPSFDTPPGLGNPHLQTILGRTLRLRLDASYSRSRLDTPDGDFIDVDVWGAVGKPRGVCLLLHGLEGSAASGYMVATAGALTARGLIAASLNFRSCSGEPNRTIQSYHSGRTDDIVTALSWLAEGFPDLPRVAVGFSLGGNALINHLGRAGAGAGLAAAAAISVPYDLAASAAEMERGLGRAYATHFLRSLRRKARHKRRLFPGEMPPTIERARSIREFDDRYTAPFHGFRDATDYYARCSAGGYVDAVETPTLLIQSRDDPLVPSGSIPAQAIRANRRLELRLTDRGGHVGFVHRRAPPGAHGWLEAGVAEYLASTL